MPDKSILDTDPLLHDRSRLAILTTLAAAGQKIDFTSLLTKLSMTRGNLSVHASKLEDAGFLEIKKSFIGKTPQTTYEITAKGRNELLQYLQTIENLLGGSLKGN